MNLDDFVLNAEDSLLLIIDIQEKLAVVMKDREKVVRNTQHLIELARMIKLPVVVSEQYPRGLGRTVPEITSALPDCRPVEKIAFNCCGEAAFPPEIRKFGKKKIIVTGMETHICVLQTTTGLLKEGYVPHVVQDAVCSRTDENWNTAIEFMRDAGAIITCTETALFQLLKVAGTEEFKAVSRRIK